MDKHAGTTPAPDPLTHLHDVLGRLGTATAAEIAAAAGMAYSTVTPKLRALEDRGQAERVRVDGRAVWQLTTPAGTDRQAATTPEEDTTPPHDDTAQIRDDRDSGGPTGTTEPAQPTAPRDVDGPLTGDGGPATVTDPPDTDPPDTDPPGPPDQPDPQPVADHAGPADPPAAATTAEATPGRRPPGSLRDAALRILQRHPDRTYKVRELCRLIDQHAEPGTAKASAGAVSNVLDRLTGDGTVTRVTEHPATYQAT